MNIINVQKRFIYLYKNKELQRLQLRKANTLV